MPDGLDREGRQFDWRVEDTQAFAQRFRDALADSEHDVGLAHDWRGRKKMGDLDGHPPAQPSLRQRRVDDASRSAARGNERVRERSEGFQRKLLADCRVILANDAHEALFENPPRMGAGQLTEDLHRIDQQIHPARRQVFARARARARYPYVDARPFVPQPFQKLGEQDQLEIVVGRNQEPSPRPPRIETGRRADRALKVGERPLERFGHGSRPGCRLHSARRAHQQPVAQPPPQPAERMAHSRLRQSDLCRGAGNATLREERLEHNEKVEVELTKMHVLHRAMSSIDWIDASTAARLCPMRQGLTRNPEEKAPPGAVAHGSAAIQGKLWGARARDWADLNEPAWRQVFEDAVRLAGAGPGKRLLDIGCGAGGALVVARERGAEVAGLDASANFVAIARERLPGARIEMGEMEALPFADQAFDIVTGINSFQFAGDIVHALVEAGRVLRPGGTLLMLHWGMRQDCEFISGTMPAVFALLPAGRPGAPPPRPLAEPGVIEALMREAGLVPKESGEFPAPLVAPDADTAVRIVLTGAARAIDHAGEEAVATAIRGTLPKFTRPDGSVVWNNRFRWVTATRA
jgi:SAM-dependent methyltransferase